MSPISWSHPGALNVKLIDGLGYEIILWTRSGAHGNEWHEAQCPVPQQLTNFQVSFFFQVVFPCLNSSDHQIVPEGKYEKFFLMIISVVTGEICSIKPWLNLTASYTYHQLTKSLFHGSGWTPNPSGVFFRRNSQFKVMQPHLNHI